MTETDATKRPTQMPVNFIPYVDKYRIYKIFKDMVRDLVIDLPKDHLKHMKVFVRRHMYSSTDAERVIILVSPELQIDIKKVVKDLIKNLGVFVITRRSIIDRYEKHDDFVPGCMSPVLMSEVTKKLTLKDPVPQAGWLMFDHPCTVREARCLQQDGVLPTVTLVLLPPPPQEPPTQNQLTAERSFFEQDFEGLKYAYKATLKEVYVESSDDSEKIAAACFNGIQACLAGLQGAGQGHWARGAPGVYRVVLIGPRGSGRSVQGRALAEHFGLVFVSFRNVYLEAANKSDDAGERLRNYGPSMQLKSEIIKRRLLMKDCIDQGWVLVGYPTSAPEFEKLEAIETPPNRIIFLTVDMSRARARVASRGVDWCTGEQRALGSGARVIRHPEDQLDQLEADLDFYFTEALAELRGAAGITAVTVNGNDPIESVQVRLQAAVMAAPAFDIECGARLRNVHGE